MWGSESWGKLVWHEVIVESVPMLDQATRVLLVAVILIGTVSLVRHGAALR